MDNQTYSDYLKALYHADDNTIKVLEQRVNAEKTRMTNEWNDEKTRMTNEWNDEKTRMTNEWNAKKNSLTELFNAQEKELKKNYMSEINQIKAENQRLQYELNHFRILTKTIAHQRLWLIIFVSIITIGIFWIFYFFKRGSFSIKRWINCDQYLTPYTE